MRDPYRTLSVPRDADNATIHAAYLALVRRFSPDRDGERFERVRAAYETIATRRKRIEHELFSTDLPTLGELLEAAITPRPAARPSEEQLRCALAVGLIGAGAARRQSTRTR